MRIHFQHEISAAFGFRAAFGDEGLPESSWGRTTWGDQTRWNNQEVRIKSGRSLLDTGGESWWLIRSGGGGEQGRAKQKQLIITLC